MRRIAIAGGPRTGKTTYARKLAAEHGLALVSTDDFASMGWSEASEHVAGLLGKGAPGVVEGVAVPRALRKALAASEARPVDRLLILEAPRVPRTPGQEAMAKGCRTVLAEIEPELRRRGVVIEYVVDPGEHDD